ncbi:MAG TPA: HWE histidine kinase domain-containing protein [Phenylobacterium sp.]|uniref:sensor histidine kinase n=1 Tax=Phenylobacterium sp. TaxID=1871053 RepID=UPI002F95AAD6
MVSRVPPDSSTLDFLQDGGEMGVLIRAHDWARTPLGAPRGWPQSLKTIVRLLLTTRHPMVVWWGPELIQIYNDAYSLSIGPERHPSTLGQRAKDCWAETWPVIGPQIEQVMSGGPGTWHENQLAPITRNGHLEEVYWTYSFSPIHDEAARNAVGGVLVVCSETTEIVLAQKRRTEEAERWWRIFEQAPSFIGIMRGPEHVHEFVNASHRRLFNSQSWLGRPVREAFPEIADQGFFELLDQVYETGERLVFAATPVRYHRAPDAPEETRYLDFVYAPIIEDGQVTGIFCEGFDVTEAICATKALRDSEEQLRLASEAAEVGFWDLDVPSDTLFLSPRIRKMFGLPQDTPLTPRDVAACIHPGDVDRVSAAFAAALDPKSCALYDVEFRTIGREDRVVRWVAMKGRGIFEPDGRCVRVVGAALDITSRKTTEAHLRLMVNELNHRVKNSLAIVQAIAAQTLRGDAVPDEVREAFTDRLLALSKAHDVLTDERWVGASLHDLARQAAEPYETDGAGRFVIEGPPVNLNPKSAIAVALAFHELATNAAKYGALSTPEGKVSIRWSTRTDAEGTHLHLTWQETGGPQVSAPTTTGFGARLLTKGLAAELRGAVDLAYPPSGVTCTIDALVTDRPVAA